MPSKNDPDPLDLSRIPTTAADRAALTDFRALDRLDAVQYLQFLLAFTERHPPTREVPPLHEPFAL